MKNIAIIIGSLRGGGAERVAGYLSIGLSKRYNVYFFLRRQEALEYEYQGNIIYLNRQDLERDVRNRKKEFEIDCAISFLDATNWDNIRTRGREKVIVSVRNVYSRYHYFSKALHEVHKAHYQNADAVVSCAYGVKEDMVCNMGMPSEGIKVIPNFIYSDRIEERSREELPVKLRAFLAGSEYILNIGRLTEAKNQRMMIRQFAYFHQHFDTSIKLIILGSGDLQSKLEKDISDQGLSDYVLMENFSKNPFPYLANASLLAVSSKWEGFPNVIGESLALGVPVVSTDCISGPREILDDRIDYSSHIEGYEIAKRGILVENTEREWIGTSHFFAEALHRAISDKGLRECFKKNALAYTKRYDNEAILQSWIDVIEEGYSRQDSFLLQVNELNASAAKVIIIYGAGAYGKKVLSNLRRKEKTIFFAVSRYESLERNVEGIAIRELKELVYYRNEADLLISVLNPDLCNEMAVYAEALGFKKIYYPCV